MKIKKVKRAEHTFIKNGREDAEQSVDETSGLKAEDNGPRRNMEFDRKKGRTRGEQEMVDQRAEDARGS